MKELEALKETEFSVINEVFVVDVENNEVTDKNDTHHERKLLSDVEEYTNEDETDEEGVVMIVGFFSERSLMIFIFIFKTVKITLEGILYSGGVKVRKFQLVSNVEVC